MIQTAARDELVQVHYNVPQLMYWIVRASINILLWGRRTGKTQGPMAMFSVDNVHRMPRSNGFFLGSTYEQLLTRTLPPVIAGWEMLGYYPDVHFWIQKFPPEKFRIPRAYIYPLKADHYISWYNGSGIYLVSQDRPGTINGVASQWGGADEAKFLNYEKLKEEALLTLSGLANEYGHLSNYLSLLFASDMPTTRKGKWLIDFKQEMDAEVVDAIIQLQTEVMKLQEQLDKADEANQKKISKAIEVFEKHLNDLRKGTVYCSYASTLDNIHTLGMEPIKLFKRILSDFIFQVSVLNKELYKIENSFYSQLDEDVHGYNAVNYAYFDTLEFDFKKEQKRDCRWDSDIAGDQPLCISCDYNNAINSIVTGQLVDGVGKFLSSKYVLSPLLLKDCVALWDEYYKYHPRKEVYYYYDHTALSGGKDASSNINFADEWTTALQQKGWVVHRKYIGKSPYHKSRHLLWNATMQGADTRLPTFRYNLTNCHDWQVSAQQAGSIRVGNEIKKDKRSEFDPNTPPQEATHLSECGDILLWGWVRSKFKKESTFVDLIYRHQ